MAYIRYHISWEKFGYYPEFGKFNSWMKQTLEFSVSSPRIGRSFMKANLPPGKVRNFISYAIYR